MPTLNGLLEANAPYSDKAFLTLLTVEHTTLSTPLRIVRNNEDVTSNGNVYTAFPFEVELPNSSDDINGAKLMVGSIAAPYSPTAVTGESISEGNNTLANAPVVAGSVTIYDGATQEGTDDGNGNLVGATIDAGSGIVYNTGAMVIGVTPNPSGALTVNYSYLSSATSIAELIRGLNPTAGPLLVTIQLVLSDDLNTVQLQWPTMEWRSIAMTFEFIEGNLTSVTNINTPLHERSQRFTPTNFPSLF